MKTHTGLEVSTLAKLSSELLREGAAFREAYERLREHLIHSWIASQSMEDREALHMKLVMLDGIIIELDSMVNEGILHNEGVMS